VKIRGRLLLIAAGWQTQSMSDLITAPETGRTVGLKVYAPLAQQPGARREENIGA
jgi:hypothetical protein